MVKILFGLGVLVAIFYFGLIFHPTNCLVLGANICHFTEVEKLLSSDEPNRVERMIVLCSQMNRSPKKNKCYYFVASVASGDEFVKACEGVVDDGRYSESKCLSREWF